MHPRLVFGKQPVVPPWASALAPDSLVRVRDAMLPLAQRVCLLGCVVVGVARLREMYSEPRVL